MDPIISPTWIYLIHVADTIYGLSIFVLFVSVVALLLFKASSLLQIQAQTQKKSSRLKG